MSRLLLYTDLGPSWPWLFATVHANRDALAEHGVDLGPFNPWACKLLPAHSRFWTIVPEGGVTPPPLAADLQGVVARLDAGRDVLLMSWVLALPAHRSLARLLRRQPGLARHEVRAVFLVGRPACVLEQRYRWAGKALPSAVEQTLLSRCKMLPLLVKDARRAWGEANVALLADTSDSPVATPCTTLAERLFAILGAGCPPLRLPEHLPRHPLFLASYVARRLSRTLEVRENAWPPLDAGLFMDCLRASERSWGTEPVSPLDLRQRLIREGAAGLRALEALLELESGALDCPDWLAAQAEASPEAVYGQPLPAERVAAFAAALPPAVREPLRQRYANDAPLLTPDQRALAKALAVPEAAAPSALPAVAARDSVTIGEPVPPVELTVLTMTYNHERYIADCMDSVLAQRTDFPVRHIVLDHRSTDATPAIVTAYAERHPSIRAVLLSQRRPSENVMGLFLRCRTRYAALCDGDDYFTDPLKLQKQVDFLESRPHCALCFHPVRVVHEDGSRPPYLYPPLSMLPNGVREEYDLEDLFQGNMIQTNSAVYRWRFRDGMPHWFRPGLCPGDWYWHLLHAELGKIGFLREVMSVYRRHSQAVYATASGSSTEHRRVHGMAELRTYQAVNEHFTNRYFPHLAALANGVFADFLRISMEEGDQSLLDRACDAFPDFARHFLADLKMVQVKNTAARKI
ncbi:glycosyltransferase [Desulfovibrio sp. ZJ369]|uniref:glycosyltransferase n=1 Tax=Desulfovibrio sp. ZJ369 TaxID=2709793 RepID=UPI0013EBEAF4|nr:glycosyltransferase [Desulfovibrio sp. ZJ369]